MNLSPSPIQKFFDNDGRPLAGGRLFTYAAGTSTKVATYTDSTGGASNTNPIVLDFRGECRLWIDPLLSYKYALAPRGVDDPPSNPIWTVDNITAGPAQQDNAAVDTGSVNNIALAIPQVTSPVAFTRIVFKAANTNTGPVTISINGGTAKALTWQSTGALPGAAIKSGGLYEAIYDGAQWQLQGPTLQPRDIRLYDSSIVADGATDCTSAIIAVANAVGGAYTIPYNVLYDKKAVIAGLDSDVVLIDFSQINDLTSAGETTKNFGLVSSSEAVNDMTWAVQDGHHPNFLMNNFGSSGGFSATHRLASLVWGVGMFQNAGLAKRGSRGAATFQFLKDPGANYWINKLTLNAPWLSIAGEYEDWKAGEVIPGAGVYRRASGAQYVSAGGGTTANPAPSNLSGTAPDGGGVQWTFLDSADRSIYQCDQYGRWLIGSDAVTFTFEHLTIPVDPGGGSYSMALGPFSGAISKTSQLQLFGTDGAGVRVFVPFDRAVSGVGRAVIRASGGTTMGYWDDTKGFALTSCTLSQAPSATSPAVGVGGTINTANLGVSKVTPAGAVTGVILQSGTVDGQECTVMNQSGSSITFAAFATSHVASGVACVIPATRAMRFVWDSVAAAWYACA